MEEFEHRGVLSDKEKKKGKDVDNFNRKVRETEPENFAAKDKDRRKSREGGELSSLRSKEQESAPEAPKRKKLKRIAGQEESSEEAPKKKRKPSERFSATPSPMPALGMLPMRSGYFIDLILW